MKLRVNDWCSLILLFGMQFVLISGSIQDGFEGNGWRETRERQGRHLGDSTTNAALDRSKHSTQPQTAQEMFVVASDNAIRIVSPPLLYPDIQRPGYLNGISSHTRSTRAGSSENPRSDKGLIMRSIHDKADKPRTGLVLLSTIGLIESVIVSSALLGMGGAVFTALLIVIKFLLRAILVFFTGVYFL